MKEHQMKNLVTAEYKRRLSLILKSNLNGKDEIKGISGSVVTFLRYGAGISN